jgi:general secretion pathway protein M
MKALASPGEGNNRLTAVLLFVIALIVLYLLVFHWFIIRHLDYGEEIGELRDNLGRFQAVAAQRDRYEQQLRDLENRKSDERLFIEGTDFDEAAADMSERLGQMVQMEAEGSCQIVSRQPVRPRVEERFQRVEVNARMRCGIEDFMKVLYALETSVPLIIADEITIIKPRTRSRRGADPAANTALDIRFNMYGYLRN